MPELRLTLKPPPSQTKHDSDDNIKTNNNASRPSTSVEISINNVVCSYSTRCRLVLRKIATEGMHVEFKKENNMVNMRLRTPLTTASIWASGKITCTGATTESDAYRAARRYARLLQRMKFKVRLFNYRVVNVLATCAMPFSVDIYRVAEKYQKECSYEPELHPGATFRIKELHATLKLFSTGSVTLTAPSVDHVKRAVTQIYPILYEFRRVVVDQQKQSASSANNSTQLKPAQAASYSLPYPAVSNGHGIYAVSAQNCSRQIIKSESSLISNGFNLPSVAGTGYIMPTPANTLTNSSSFSHYEQFNSTGFLNNYNNNNTITQIYANDTLNVFESNSSTSSSNSISAASSSSFGVYDFNNGFSVGNSTNPHSNSLTSSHMPTLSGMSNSASIFSNVSSSSNGISTSNTTNGASAATGQPFHWFNENVLVDHVFDDFLP